jgi:enamine deaminase RidA (YjgF/YER057c/UK114 family)
MPDRIETRLAEIGFQLPVAPPAVGAYAPATQVGNLVITSGQIPFVGGELVLPGKLGGDLTEDDGVKAAQICTLNALAQIKSCVGSLDKVKRILRLEGYVHAAPGFRRHANVLNGASEILNHLYGDSGKHTRIALGVNEMPLGAAIQICLWAEV